MKYELWYSGGPGTSRYQVGAFPGFETRHEAEAFIAKWDHFPAVFKIIERAPAAE